MNIVPDIISLVNMKITTPILSQILKIIKDNDQEREKLTAHLKNISFLETISNLRDISEVQLYLILYFKTINIKEIENIKPFDELSKINNKISLSTKLKEMLFHLTKYTTIRGFICEKLELPTKTFTLGKTNIYLFFNEKNIKFLIDKEIVTLVYSTIKNYRIGLKFVDLTTVTKKVKIYFKEYQKNKKSLTVLLKQNCEEFITKNIPLKPNLLNHKKEKETVFFEDKNVETGVSFKFVSDFNTNTSFLSNLTNDFDKKSNHFFKKSNFIEEGDTFIENQGCNTPNSSKLVDPAEIVESENIIPLLINKSSITKSTDQVNDQLRRSNNLSTVHSNNKYSSSIQSSDTTESINNHARSLSSSSNTNKSINKNPKRIKKQEIHKTEPLNFYLRDLNEIFEKQIENEKVYIFKTAEEAFKSKKYEYKKLRKEIEKYSNKSIKLN